MDFVFSPKRLLILLVLLGVFAALGGFSNPALNAEFHSARMTKAWFYCMSLYITGAGSVTVVDHWVGLIDRSNIRWLYVILGVLLMGSSLVWMHVLRSSAEVS